MPDVRIDAPGAGEWIMKRARGVFTPGYDHSFSRHYENDEVRGGIVLSNYLGAAMTIHMAGADKRWCSRDLLWIVFDYAFNQLGCLKLIGQVRSDNYHTIAMDLRGGWEFETVVKDVYAPGIHMVLLAMTKDSCPWLNYQPREWRSNRRVA